MHGVKEPENLNDENFNEAIRQIDSVKIHWVMQLELVLGHPVQLWLDVQALHGRFELVRPFVHQAVSGTLGAISMLAFDGQVREKITRTQRVHLTLAAPGHATSATLEQGTLTVYFKLGEGAEFATEEARGAILAALGVSTGARDSMSAGVGGGEERQAEEPELAALDATAAAEPEPETTGGDVYQRAEAYMQELENVMRHVGLWPGEKPPGEIEVKGAFGGENMAFTQWLAWVLMQRVRDIIRERGKFPAQSQVSTFARREFDGVPGGDEVADVLMAFDDFINGAR